MIILVFGVLLIFYCVATKRFNVWMGMLFVLLIMGFQEGIPGDYMEYKDIFTRGIADVGVQGSTLKSGEFAQIWTVEVLSRFMNFHMYVLLASIVQIIAMGLMVKVFAAKKYQYFGVLLIFFTSNIMLIQMKAMRQGYAIDFLLLAYYLLGKRKIYWSLIPAIVAYGFHNSSIIAMPFFVILWMMMFLHRKEKSCSYELPIVKDKIGVKTAIWVAVGLVIFYIFKFVVFDSYINPILMGLEAFSYSGYLEQIEEGRGIAWWIILYYTIIVFCVTLYYVNEHSIFQKYIALLIIICEFLTVGTFGFGNLMRTSAYFLVFSIVVFPNIAAMLKQSYGKRMADYFVLFNMLFVMMFSVRMMASYETTGGTGYGPFTFSFLNW